MAEGAVITEHSRAGGEAYHEMAEIKAPDGDLVYDGAPKAATVTYSAGWQGGDLEITYSGDNYINAGEVTAGITIEGISAGVQYTIKKEHSSVTTHPVGAHLTYTAGAQALVTAGEGTGGTMRYSLTSGGLYSADIPAATDGGSYTGFYKIVGDGNHYDTAEYSVTAVIGAAPVSFDVLNSRQLYDGRPKDAVVKQRAGQVPLDERDFLVVYRRGGYPADPRSEGEYEVWVILRNEKFQLEGEDYATREKQVGTLTIDAAAPAGYTAYYDPSDDSMKAENATVLSGVSASALWNSGWYVVRNGATIDGSVTVTGDVNLILDEGCMLMITKGITVNRGNSLTIWGRAYEGGMLVANGGDYQAGIGGSGEQDNGAIAINGGTIQVTGGLYASGIGSSGIGLDRVAEGVTTTAGDISLSHGSVTAQGGPDSDYIDTLSGGVGIGGGGSSGPGFFDGPLGEINTDSTITISGGEIYAKSGDTIPAIGAVPNFHQSFAHVTKSAGTSVEWTGNPNSEWSWTEVEIQPMILVEGVTILGNTELTYGGDSGTLTAVVTPADADIKTVTWDVLSGADTIELRDNQKRYGHHYAEEGGCRAGAGNGGGGRRDGRLHREGSSHIHRGRGGTGRRRRLHLHRQRHRARGRGDAGRERFDGRHRLYGSIFEQRKRGDRHSDGNRYR